MVGYLNNPNMESQNDYADQKTTITKTASILKRSAELKAKSKEVLENLKNLKERTDQILQESSKDIIKN